MKDKNKQNGAGVQDAPADITIPEIPQIRQYLEDDLQRAINFLTAIKQDAEMKDLMAVFMHGRITNYRNQPTEPKK